MRKNTSNTSGDSRLILSLDTLREWETYDFHPAIPCILVNAKYLDRVLWEQLRAFQEKIQEWLSRWQLEHKETCNISSRRFWVFLCKTNFRGIEVEYRVICNFSDEVLEEGKNVQALQVQNGVSKDTSNIVQFPSKQ